MQNMQKGYKPVFLKLPSGNIIRLVTHFGTPKGLPPGDIMKLVQDQLNVGTLEDLSELSDLDDSDDIRIRSGSSQSSGNSGSSQGNQSSQGSRSSARSDNKRDRQSSGSGSSQGDDEIDHGSCPRKIKAHLPAYLGQKTKALVETHQMHRECLCGNWNAVWRKDPELLLALQDIQSQIFRNKQKKSGDRGGGSSGTAKLPTGGTGGSGDTGDKQKAARGEARPLK
jgi:hypothetical protein